MSTPADDARALARAELRKRRQPILRPVDRGAPSHGGPGHRPFESVFAPTIVGGVTTWFTGRRTRIPPAP